MCLFKSKHCDFITISNSVLLLLKTSPHCFITRSNLCFFFHVSVDDLPLHYIIRVNSDLHTLHDCMAILLHFLSLPVSNCLLVLAFMYRQMDVYPIHLSESVRIAWLTLFIIVVYNLMPVWWLWTNNNLYTMFGWKNLLFVQISPRNQSLRL